MSGVDERVERAKRSLESLRLAARIDPVLKGWCDDVAAAVAGLEQRADDAEARISAEKLHAAKAFRSALLYAGCGDDAVTVADRFVDAYSLAAAVVSAEPTP